MKYFLQRFGFMVVALHRKTFLSNNFLTNINLRWKCLTMIFIKYKIRRPLLSVGEFRFSIERRVRNFCHAACVKPSPRPSGQTATQDNDLIPEIFSEAILLKAFVCSLISNSHKFCFMKWKYFCFVTFHRPTPAFETNKKVLT